MEKNTRNPDSVKSDSLQSLSAASIEKLRIESEKKKDSAKNRNYDSQSSKQRPLPKSQEIDKQISELACLIRRLQDEIVELSRNATQNPSLVDTSAKDDDKNTQTYNVIKKINRSSGCNESKVDDTTVIVGTVQTQPSLKDSSSIDAEEHPEGIQNVGDIDKARFDNLEYSLMNCSHVASETKPDPFHKPQADNNVYDNVYQLNMDHGADENEEDFSDNETDEYANDENEHVSEFDLGPDIGDTTVVENNYDNDYNMDDAES